MKKIINLLLILVTIFAFGLKKTFATELELVSDAKSAILLEVSTGTVIYSKNKELKSAPASMTKIMTMLLVLEAIDNNIITFDTILTTSDFASSMGGSQIYLEVGEQMSVEDLFKSMCIASANDASVVLAEAVGGSYQNFIQMMNERAKELGMVNTVFKNCNGLPEEGHESTCEDIGILSRYIVRKYQEKILKYTSIYEDYIRTDTDNKFWLVNTNKLVKYVDGLKGLKTGYCGDDSGYCLSALLERNGVQYLAVVMGSSSSKMRNYEVVNMLNYAYSNYELMNIHKKDDVIETIFSRNINPNTIHIVVSEDVNILKKKSEKIDKIETKVKLDIKDWDYESIKDSSIGILNLIVDGKTVGSFQLKVSENIKKESFINMFLNVIKDIFLV